MYVSGILRRVHSVGEYSGRYVKADGVDDDHGKNATEYPLFPHDQMEPRVENYGLTSDHAVPANGYDSHANIVIEGLLARNQLEEFEEESERMQHAAITRYQQRPEVETSMSFEGEEDLDIEFGDIVPCDCSEGRYGHIYALVDRNCSPRFSFRDSGGHFRGSEDGRFGKLVVEGGWSKVSSVDS